MRDGGPYTEHDRSLERALIANFVIHGVAMLAMATLLAPYLPGGTDAPDAERIVRIAAHPWLFRLGWLPWQACAFADLWLAVAMVRTPWLPRVASWLVLVFTLAAVVPDQLAQAIWITRGVALAQTGPDAYLALETRIFPLTAGWGALFYTCAALGWTWAFAGAKTWSRALTWLSVPLWTTMLVAVLAPLAPASVRPSAVFVSAANALGFLQLQVWLGLVTEEVLRRARPTPTYANSRLIGALLTPFRRLPGSRD